MRTCRITIRISAVCLIAGCLFIFTSCKNRAGNQSPKGYKFDNTIELKANGTLRLNEEIMLPADMAIQDSLLFVCDIASEKGTLLTFDLTSGNCICRNAQKGRGPAEVLFPIHMEMNFQANSVDLYDGQRKELVCFAADSVKMKNHINPQSRIAVPPGAIRMLQISDSLLLTQGSDDPDKMFSLYSGRNPIHTFFAYPDSTKASTNKQMAFQGDFRANKTRDRFVYAAFRSDLIISFQLDGNNVTDIHSNYSYLPVYEDQSDKNVSSVTVEASLPDGFRKVCVTDECIYALHSGRTKATHPGNYHLCNEIYVLDWQGNPIQKIILDHDTNTFCIDEANNKIYAPFLQGDQYVIYSYPLNG